MLPFFPCRWCEKRGDPSTGAGEPSLRPSPPVLQAPSLTGAWQGAVALWSSGEEDRD